MQRRQFFTPTRIRIGGGGGGGQNVVPAVPPAAAAAAAVPVTPQVSGNLLLQQALNTSRVYQALSNAEKMASVDTQVMNNNNYYYDRLQDSIRSLSYSTVATLYTLEALTELQREYINTIAKVHSTQELPNRSDMYINLLHGPDPLILSYNLQWMEPENVLGMLRNLILSLQIVQARRLRVLNLYVRPRGIDVDDDRGRGFGIYIGFVDGRVRVTLSSPDIISYNPTTPISNTLTNIRESGQVVDLGLISRDFLRDDTARLSRNNNLFLILFVLVLFKNTRIDFV